MSVRMKEKRRNGNNKKKRSGRKEEWQGREREAYLKDIKE
jgi:hypothetical protein